MKSRRVSVDGNADIDTANSNAVGQVVAEKSPGSAPNFLAPTKAFKVQSVVRTVKQVFHTFNYHCMTPLFLNWTCL